MPAPPQCGQGTVEPSSTPVRMRWRDISSRPKCEMRPTWMRARSFFRQSFSCFSTARLLRFSSMSMKSMTMRPARSRRRSWRAISSAASRLVLERGVLDVVLAGRAAGVDVDRDQRLGLVDDDVAAGLQRHLGREHRVELRLDAVAREERLRVAVGLHGLGMARHEHAHEVLGLAIAVLAGDEDLVDVLVVEVADRALDQRAFLVDEGRRGRVQRQLAHGLPQAQQIFEVALDLGLGARGAGGAQDDAHALRHFEILGDLLQALAVGGVGDLARDAAAARRVRHQHRIAAGERQIGGERRALVAALFLDDLHQQDLAALDDFLDLVLAAMGRAGARAPPPARRRRRRPARSIVLVASSSVVLGAVAAVILAPRLGLSGVPRASAPPRRPRWSAASPSADRALRRRIAVAGALRHRPRTRSAGVELGDSARRIRRSVLAGASSGGTSAAPIGGGVGRFLVGGVARLGAPAPRPHAARPRPPRRRSRRRPRAGRRRGRRGG